MRNMIFSIHRAVRVEEQLLERGIGFSTEGSERCFTFRVGDEDAPALDEIIREVQRQTQWA